MVTDNSSGRNPSGNPRGITASIDHLSIAPSQGGCQLVVTVTGSLSIPGAVALGLIAEALAELARMRGGRP
jgi:hypothetical protein